MTKPAFFSRLLSLVRHPFFPFVPLVTLLAVAKENFPFTHYPMYSRPGPGPISYFYLTDSNDEPLPVQFHCGITSPRMKRLFETKLKKLKRELPEASDAERHRLVLDEVFPFLRTASERRDRPLPQEPLRIYRGLLYQIETGFEENVALVGEEGADTALDLLGRESAEDDESTEEI